MEVFRICKAVNSRTLMASGSANRWNKRGECVIYSGSSRSLSTLELIVHRSSIVPAADYKVMVISIADDDALVTQFRMKELAVNWRTFSAYSSLQEMGSRWYLERKSLILKVPSAVIPYEYNYVIHTEHPAFHANVELVRTEDYFWDDRLLLNQ